MALLGRNLFKTVVGNTLPTLTPPPGRSYLVHDVRVHSAATDYATISVDKSTVGFYRVKATVRGNHLPFTIQDKSRFGLMKFLTMVGVDMTIPVPEGYSLQISGVHQSSSVVVIHYDEYDGGDVLPTRKNGPEATEYTYINYGRAGSGLVAGSNRLTVQQTISEFPAFPFGQPVGGNREILLHGVLFGDVGKASASQANRQITSYLKMVQDRTVLFDRDKNGIPFRGVASTSADTTDVGVGQSLYGDYSTIDEREPFLLLAGEGENGGPLRFGPGTELEVSVITEVLAGSANITAEEAEVGLIQTVRMGVS